MVRRKTSVHTREEILRLIGSGRARSRRELSDVLDLSASTVSQYVQILLADGVIVEAETGESSGGRRPRGLRLAATDEFLAVVDLGGRHARIAIMRRGDSIAAVRDVDMDVADGPEAVVAAIASEILDLLEAEGGQGRLVGIGVALPGPVGASRRGVESPSRMPGWTGRDVAALLQEAMGIPALVENDANAMAVGEHFAAADRRVQTVTVKAGTAIGSGIIINGEVYRGSGGVAGDITHTRVAAAAETPCSCGNVGCLETVASGAALVRMLAERGRDVHTTADVIDAVRNADPVATALTRTAGRHLGEVLCAVVNFFNPGAIYIGGALATLEPFVSAIRSQLYEGAHPLVTRELVIAPAELGADATLIGVARLLDDRLLTA